MLNIKEEILVRHKKLLADENLKSITIPILKSEGVNIFPPIVTLDINSTCNHRCIGCTDAKMVFKDKIFIPIERLKELLKLFKKRQVRCIEISGCGEPTIHPNFKEFLNELTKYNFRLALVTNGSGLFKNRDLFKKTKLDWIRVSINAITHKTYNYLHGLKSSSKEMDLVLKGCNELISNGCNVGFSFLIYPKINTKEIYQAAEVAKKIGFSYIEYKPIVNPNNKSILKIDENEIFTIREELKKAIKLSSKEFKVVSPKSLNDLLENGTNNVKNDKEYSHCWTCLFRTVIAADKKGINVWPCPYLTGKISLYKTNFNKKINNKWFEDKTRIIETKKINPQKSCNFFCIRDENNLFLEKLSKISKENPKFIAKIKSLKDIKDANWI